VLFKDKKACKFRKSASMLLRRQPASRTKGAQEGCDGGAPASAARVRLLEIRACPIQRRHRSQPPKQG
jgi:hypothetical protein